MTNINLDPFQSPTGVPGYLASTIAIIQGNVPIVSIPNGRPRLFSLHLIPDEARAMCPFQSPTGVPGYLAAGVSFVWMEVGAVSIPNGRPRLFSRTNNTLSRPYSSRFNPQRASQAI